MDIPFPARYSKTSRSSIKKSDSVKARFEFVVLIELMGFVLMAILTALRMTVLSGAAPYVQNPLMSANPVYLAFVLIIYAAFNLIFVRQFYKTAYKIGKPFIIFIAAALVITGAAEALHYVPGLAFLNAVSGEGMAANYLILAAAAVVYALVTYLSYKASCRSFESVDF